MIAVQINDVKNFMNAILADSLFDPFLVNEVVISTFNTFSISGRLNETYYSKEEWENLENKDFSKWSVLRPICFQIIKGHKTPVKLNLVLLLSPRQIQEFLERNQLEQSSSSITSMVLNIRYDQGVLTCVTGLSFSTFTMDKTPERAWDDYVKSFLTSRFETELL